MTDDQRQQLLAAIGPGVDPKAQARILRWAEHILLNAQLLSDALDGTIVLTGFPPGGDEPTWDVPGGQRERFRWFRR